MTAKASLTKRPSLHHALQRLAGRLLLPALLGLGASSTLHCGTGPVVGGECRSGLSPCGHSCVNLGADPENCGRCGYRCEEDEQCLVGVCIDTGPAVIGRPVDGGVLLDDGGLLLPDGAVVDPGQGGASGAGGGGAGAGGSNGGNGGSEPGGGCAPPYSSAAYCGSCSVRCEEPLPYCAPAGDSFACVEACSDGLLLCGDRCVDTTSDIDHCGACNQRCPTAICRDSTCVGGVGGHVVAMCMNLETYRASAPQNALLGNAIFLAGRDSVRVLGYAEHATARSIAGVQRAISEADANNARQIELSVTGSSAALTGAVGSGEYDVLLIYDQALAPSGSLASLGQSLLDPLTAFTAQGGVVVVLASSSGTGEMHEFLSASGLLGAVIGQTDATGALLYNNAPSDAVGLNVFGEFRALSSSCTFELDAAASGSSTLVVTDVPSSGDGSGSPSVIHRVTISG